MREQVACAECLAFSAGEIDKNDFGVAAEIPEHLAAGAAGRCQIVGFGDDDHSSNRSGSLRDGAKESGALGADGESVGSGFNIAAAERAPSLVFDRSPDEESGVWRASAESGLAGDIDERVDGHSFSVGNRRERSRLSCAAA